MSGELANLGLDSILLLYENLKQNFPFLISESPTQMQITEARAALQSIRLCDLQARRACDQEGGSDALTWPQLPYPSAGFLFSPLPDTLCHRRLLSSCVSSSRGPSCRLLDLSRDISGIKGEAWVGCRLRSQVHHPLRKGLRL